MLRNLRRFYFGVNFLLCIFLENFLLCRSSNNLEKSLEINSFRTPTLGPLAPPSDHQLKKKHMLIFFSQSKCLEIKEDFTSESIFFSVFFLKNTVPQNDILTAPSPKISIAFRLNSLTHWGLPDL